MSDFFVSDDVHIGKPKHPGEEDFLPNEKVDDVAEQESPPGYVPVKLSSNGKLKGIPKVVHVKDYTGRDTLNLSMATSENQLETILGIVSNIVYEDIDVNLLHENDLEEILINVYANFWGSALTEIPYPFTQKEFDELTEDEQDAIKKKTWSPKTDIVLGNIDTKVVADNFYEPITITAGDTKVVFILPRTGHLVRAGKIVSRKYIKQENRWKNINSLIRKERPSQDNIDAFLREHLGEEYFDYVDYSRQKTTDLFLIKQAQCIQSVNGKEMTTIDEQINAYNNVPLQAWEQLGQIQKEYSFGVNHYIKVKSPFTGKPVERRFSFRFQDFFPQVREESTSRCSVSFG